MKTKPKKRSYIHVVVDEKLKVSLEKAAKADHLPTSTWLRMLARKELVKLGFDVD